MWASEGNELVSKFVDAGALYVFLLLAVVALVVTPWFARRTSADPLATALALTSIAAILAITLGIRTPTSHEDVSVSWIFDRDLWGRAFVPDADWVLNVALFVPAGWFSTWAWRRPFGSIGGLVLLSILIEVVQGALQLGSADPGDLVADALGAALGAVLGWWTLRLGSERLRSVWARHRRVASVAIVVAIVCGSVGGWLALRTVADARLDDLARELDVVFAGTTAADISTRLESDATTEELFSSTSVTPDYLGPVAAETGYAGRWSTVFLGFHRCVFIRWTPDGHELRTGSGDVCTAFSDRPGSQPTGRRQR